MFLRTTYSAVIAIVVAALLSACVPKSSPPLKPSTQGELTAEPTPAAQFLVAFRRGDEAAAERVASPLYSEEWARRNISIRDRQAWLPAWYRASKSATDWLAVSYIDGFVDADGKGHLLYLGHAGRAGDRTNPSVWRLDTDPNGRVTWAEMVWLFSDQTDTVTTVSGSAAAPASTLPPAFSRMQPRFVVGVHSARDWEGYYAVWHTAGDHLALNFFAIDESGDIRPGAWTYSQPS